MGQTDSRGPDSSDSKLELRGSSVTTLPKDLITKGKYPNLTSLSLLHTRVASLDGISSISFLSVLDLTGSITLCKGTAPGLLSLAELGPNRLQTLVLAFCGLSAESAPSVRKVLQAVSVGLEVLRLEGNSHLGDALALSLPSSLPKLHRLSCSMCSLKKLPSNLLQIAPNLSILKAARNQLSSCALACFSSSASASKLTEISLEDNCLSSEDLRPLAACTYLHASLETIDISRNKNIDSISTLTCFSGLQLLLADDCSITSIPLPPLVSSPHTSPPSSLSSSPSSAGAMFPTLLHGPSPPSSRRGSSNLSPYPSASIFPSITRISLRKNRIENASGNWFLFTPKIQTIDLGENHISSWPLGVESLVNLKHLRLSSNSISSLPSTGLSGLPSSSRSVKKAAAIMPCLEILELGDNLLSGGPEASSLFSRLRFPALHELDLSRNFLDDSIYQSLAVALASQFSPSSPLEPAQSPASSPSIHSSGLLSSSPAGSPPSSSPPSASPPSSRPASPSPLPIIDDAAGHLNSSSATFDDFHPLRKLDLGFNRFTSLPPKEDLVDKLPILENLLVDGNEITSSALAQVESAAAYAPQVSQLCLHYCGLKPDDFPPNFIPVAPSQQVVTYHRGVSGPSEILPNFLYLGSALDASCYRILKQKNISHILTIACGLRPRFPAEFKYHCVDIEDMDEADLIPHFAPCHELMREAEENGTGVLVHCRAGVSRSATIVLSYLMKYRRLSFEDAFKHTHSIRPVILPNNGFTKQLRFFERELTKEGILPLIQDLDASF